MLTTTPWDRVAVGSPRQCDGKAVDYDAGAHDADYTQPGIHKSQRPASQPASQPTNERASEPVDRLGVRMCVVVVVVVVVVGTALHNWTRGLVA